MKSPDSFCVEMKSVLTRLGQGVLTSEACFIQACDIFDSLVEALSLPVTFAGYVEASGVLENTSFPDSPLANSPLGLSRLPVVEELQAIHARSIGLYLAIALEELVGAALRGAKLLDDFLEKSGLYPTDVREYGPPGSQ